LFVRVVAGDGDGQTEMNECMAYLRKFMNGFADQGEATRVYFPDNVVRTDDTATVAGVMVMAAVVAAHQQQRPHAYVLS
jgi:hypothetical protein